VREHLMTDLANCSKEIFQVLLRFDYKVKLYDADGMTVVEPSKARRMFAQSPNLMVSLSDADDDSSIKLLFGKSTHANDIDGLMQALRTTATKYNLTFEPKQFGKEIDAKDYQNIMSVSESKRDMHVCEGMYGTTRSSYLALDNAKLIVRHNAPIDLRRKYSRAQNIESIFIENAAGERARVPTTELYAARGLAEHVNAGGECSETGLASALQAYRATRKPSSPGNPYLAENNPVVVEFMNWTATFAPDRVLREYNDPDDPAEQTHEKATDMAIEDFDPQAFMDSPEFQDTLSGRSLDPTEGESEIGKAEIISALNVYVRHYIESYDENFSDNGFNGDTDTIAQHLYPQVEQVIQQAGWTIAADKSDRALLDTVGEGEDEFTREDILLPHPNQYDSLSKQVTKATVHDDPANPDEEHPPNAPYVSRLRTLAGIHSGRPI
jgi:hypothetical protein